jgi:hypothetical protein
MQASAVAGAPVQAFSTRTGDTRRGHGREGSRVPPKQTRPRLAGRFTLAGLAAAALVAIALADLSVHLADMFSPRLGDIARFSPDWPADGLSRVVAHGLKRDGGGTPGHWRACTLDSAAMASGGGSLVVEAEEPRFGGFRVHWAGGATSAGTADCGEAADLLVGRRDLMGLIGAAGGDGLEQSALASPAVLS